VVLAFILVVFIDGQETQLGGVAAFRDIQRCAYFAKAIEKTGNETWTTKRVYIQNKIQAHCEPKFLPKETKFWD
tara:strand:+ start:952 stop:1173 length:222 start_codon:yes stop_codon:yes gene_type:complete